tara:strand:- start:110 stop:2032 length:1923 start_codon:yes stop_codon:yes gene_type:complete
MSTTYAPSGVKTKIYPYEDFQGIDASRDKGALDTGQKQHLISIVNGYADFRGSIVRDPGATQRTTGDALIKHVAFFGRDLAVWAQKDGGGTTLKSERALANPQRVVPLKFNSGNTGLEDDTSGTYRPTGTLVYYTIVYEAVANYPDMTGFAYGLATTGTPVYSIEVAFDKTHTPVNLTQSGTLKVAVDLIFNKITVKSQGSAAADFTAFYDWVSAQQKADGTQQDYYIYGRRVDVSPQSGAHATEEVYPASAIVTTTVYNNKVIFASRDFPMYSYDGFKFEVIEAKSDPRPAYVVSVQRRLATAGQPGRRTIIDFSRVDTEDVFTLDEDVSAVQVTQASDIDVANVIGTADEIRGLGVFENSRLAVFTFDQVLVYQLHPNYTLWQIDDKANIKVGLISHNTIAQAGSDLLFCSRDGVHSLRRSETNGVTIFTIPMSNKIDLIYRDYLKSVADTEEINAFFDQDEGQYHIFFPQSDQISKRLTLTLNPQVGGESKWSSGDFLNTRCAKTLGGVTLLGTPGGIWEHNKIEDIVQYSPEMVVTTPILWQGAINDIKESYSFILQATGKGELQVESFDERGRYLSSMQFLIEDDGADDKFPDVPLSRQYERKFEHRYRGVQFRFTTSGKGLLKIIGFAVAVRTG